MSNPPIRLLQISDCHLVSDPGADFFGRNPMKTLAQVTGYIEKHEAAVNAILTTGDISHDGSHESYAILAEHFSRLNAPVYSLAGNHDVLPNFHEALNTGLLSTAGHFIVHNWLVIMLDSVIVGDESGRGRVSDTELQRLEELLAIHPDKHTLLAVHHQPVAVTSEWMDTMKIINSETLFEKLAAHPQVRGILCGHIHHDFHVQVNNINVMSCPSTCHQFLPASDEFAIDPIAPGYRWLELTDSGTFTTGVIRIDVAA